RDFHVTGVQTCALPILRNRVKTAEPSVTWRGGRVEKASTVIGVNAIDWPKPISRLLQNTSLSERLMSNSIIQKPAAAWMAMPVKIGRASGRERVEVWVA